MRRISARPGDSCRRRSSRCQSEATHVMEELEQIDVVGLGPEVLLEQVVDGALEHEGVVDGNVGNAIDLVPAGLATAGDRGVHHVVGDEEVSLQLRAGERAEARRQRPRSAFMLPEATLPGARERRTSSMHQPRTAALKYSSSESSSLPERRANVSTTESPRLSLPPGVL